MATNSTNRPSPNIWLASVDVSRFRRLANVRIAIDPQTTVIVGANNSGKTSVLAAIRKFLADSPAFGAFDLSVDQWPKLRQLGKEWEKLAAPQSPGEISTPNWEQQIQELLSCMPALDLWFDVLPGAYHVVSPFLPSLQWSRGPVGVRIRLEPASTIDELQKLAWRFRDARQPVLSHDTSARAWPMDLLDYWLRHPSDLSRVAVYKLDPAKGPLADNPSETPQELFVNAKPLDRSTLTPLIRVDFVPAQRGLGVEEADNRPGSDPHRVGLFSDQVLRFARRNLNSEGATPGHHPDLIAAVAKAQDELDAQIRSALEPTVNDVKTLGYPGLHDPQEIHFRTRIQTADL